MRTALLLAILISTSTVQAATLHVSGLISTVRSTGDNRLLDAPVPVDLAISSGPGFGASADVDLSSRFAAEIRFDRLSPDVSVRGAGLSLNAGSLDMNVASISVLATLGSGGRFTPYVGAGVVYATFGNIDAPIIRQLVDDELEIDPTFGASLAAGARLQLTDRLSLVADLRYFPVEIAIERSNSFPVDVDLNPLVLAGGLRIRLN